VVKEAQVIKLASNALIALGRPGLAMEYVDWAVTRAFSAGSPVRRIQGVRLGDFNGFSEYHSVASGVQKHELAFINGHSFGEGDIIDVGANLGLFSLLINKRFPKRRLISFEPNPSTFTSLKNNILRNQADAIECHQIGIADHDGYISFAVREHARANASISAETPERAAGAISVPCAKLDTFCMTQRVKRIALLKVDVEGFEALVFRGAQRVLADVRPGAIYFEVCPGLSRLAGFEAAETARYLADWGYALHRFGASGELEHVEANAAGSVACVENWVGIDTR